MPTMPAPTMAMSVSALIDGRLLMRATMYAASSPRPQNFGSSGRAASASSTIFSTALRRSPDSGWRGMRTRSLVPIAKTSASLMFWTR